MSAALVLALALAAGQGAASLPITLDVVVTDAQGRTVTTLQTVDFAVDEHGTPQRVVSARFVKALPPVVGAGDVAFAVQSADDERREAAQPGVRLFAVFLDEFHVAPGPGADRTRDAISRFVREKLSPRDLLVVLKPLDSLLAIRLTRDRDAALHAIESFQPRKGDYTARTPFEQKYLAATPGRLDVARAQIASSALLALASHLGGLGSMRKTLIVVSEGFECAARHRGEDVLPTLDSAIGVANRAQVAIYPFDPVGHPPGAILQGQRRDERDPSPCDAFSALASETTGRAVSTLSQLSPGLEQVLSDSGGYYELTLAPPAPVTDGRFHPVSVRIAKPGLAVRARKGYWASVPDRVRVGDGGGAGSRGAGEALPPALPRRVSPMIRPWFGTAPAANGATRVSFVWEPVPRVPGERGPAVRPARIVLKASKPDGTLVFEGAVLPAGSDRGDSAANATRAVFDLPPGKLQVQMSIEDLASKVLDTDVREVVVRPFASALAFSTPEILRARNAREYRELAGDPEAAPVVARQFSRREHLLVRFRVHNPEGEPEVTARLTSMMGSLMRELTIGDLAGGAIRQLDLPLAGLAAGGYTIELNAVSAQGRTKELVAFSVTP